LDISIKKPNKTILKRYWPLLPALAITLMVINYLYSLTQADFVIDKDIIVFDEVKQGDFTVSVRGHGILVPENIQWLSSNIDARIDRIVVKPGKLVKKGELIAELSNPRLQQLLEETQWELEAQLAESKAQKVAQKTALLFQKALMINAKLNFESSKLKQEAHNELFTQGTGAVSKIDYEETRLATIQLKQRWEIQQEIFETMHENTQAQNNAIAARIKKMSKTLERAQQQVDSLMIYATIDSVVQEVPIEAGQRISIGANIAKLAEKNSLIAELQIPEFHIQDVAINQSVVIDTRNNKVHGVVSRIDPAVVNGNVQVDVTFIENLPRDARLDLTVDGEIKITEIVNTLFVSRPLFAQSQSTASLYKISADGSFAERIPVKLGKASVNKIQVLAGLSVGEKIIISDPSSWESFRKVRIN